MTLAYVGLGANLDDPRRQLQAAFEELKNLPQTRMLANSSLYRSAPLGYLEQPEFLNAVAQLDTGLPPEALFACLKQIEERHGRQRPFAGAPRTLDLDLLLYGDAEVSSSGLMVPHPRMHERAFVLRPLLELDPEISVPNKGPASSLLAACAAQKVARID